ncbi:MAG: hypothetical protein ACRDRU_20825, partial [Pseudonocardiaceae bacterium]
GPAVRHEPVPPDHQYPLPRIVEQHRHRGLCERRGWVVAEVYVDYADVWVMPISVGTCCSVGVSGLLVSA